MSIGSTGDVSTPLGFDSLEAPARPLGGSSFAGDIGGLISGSTFGRKEELMSPIPIKKSSVER